VVGTGKDFVVKSLSYYPLGFLLAPMRRGKSLKVVDIFSPISTPWKVPEIISLKFVKITLGDPGKYWNIDVLGCRY